MPLVDLDSSFRLMYSGCLDSGATNNSRRSLLRLLAGVSLLAMGYQICFSIGAIQYRRHYGTEAAWPFRLRPNSDRFSGVERALADAGVRPGDRLLAVEGRPYEGGAQVAHLLDSKRPGDQLSIQVLRDGQSEPQGIRAPLVAVGSSQLAPLGWIIIVSLTVLTPAFCLLLGLGVAAVRPRDPLAWLLLALMLSFAQMSTSASNVTDILLGWPDVARPAAIFYHDLFAGTWSIWIFLFGIYFPERLGLDRRLPYLKWLLIGPIAFSWVGEALAGAGDSENFHLFAFLRPVLDPLAPIAFYLSMAAVSCFFMALGTKMGQASSADARRRLNLLITGSSVALTPLFILVLYGLTHQGGLDRVPEAAWIPCVLMLAVFPVTLAYVIVVQRALDVRVVIRQSLRYALAQRGVRIMQITAVAAVLTGALLLASDPGRNRLGKVGAIAAGIAAAIWIRRGADHLRGWVDRRFFREAYNAEQILSALTDQVRTMVETGPLLETVAREISGSLHVPRVAMLIQDDGCYGAAFALGYGEPFELRFDGACGTVEQLQRSRAPLQVYFDDPDSWMYREPAVTEGERERLRKLESQLLLPLAFKEKLLGFVSLSAKKSEEPYSAGDIQVLEAVAAQTGMALENSHLTELIASEVAQRERLNRDLEIAREVQERLFPQSYPAVPGLDIAGRCRPALGVGGDYYDFLELPDGSLGIGIGDVSGKGIPAALLMASLQASLRGQTISNTSDLAKLMSNVNRLIFEATPSNRYATFFYGQFEPESKRLTYVNGGHNPPMVIRGVDVLRLEEGGPVVGLFKPARYSQASIQLQSGDVVALFTDGISEAMNDADEEWGEERLIDSIRAVKDRSALEMIECIVRDADGFVAGAPQHDDMTVMIVKLM